MKGHGCRSDGQRPGVGHDSPPQRSLRNDGSDQQEIWRACTFISSDLDPRRRNPHPRTPVSPDFGSKVVKCALSIIVRRQNLACSGPSTPLAPTIRCWRCTSARVVRRVIPRTDNPPNRSMLRSRVSSTPTVQDMSRMICVRSSTPPRSWSSTGRASRSSTQRACGPSRPSATALFTATVGSGCTT